MKTIDCFSDLLPYGINCLTGEACGLGYRVLCDVTPAGKALLEKALGLRELGLRASWNGGDAVGSIMLPYEMIIPVGIFALLENGCHTVLLSKGKLYGMEGDEDVEERIRLLEMFYGTPPRRFAYRGTAGDRNVHQMSGRVE